MKRFVKVFITSILLIGLFINNTFAIGSWGVDEHGAFSFDEILVVVKDEYSRESEAVIEHIKSDYCVENVKVISESNESSESVTLTLVVYLPVSDENGFYTTVDSLAGDIYVAAILKNYRMAPDKAYLGDMNQDGKVTTDDARTILKYAADQIEVKTKTEKFLADVDKDGKITTEDARLALAMSCGIETL